MARKSVFPETKQETIDQLRLYNRSQNVEKRISFRSQIILDWKEGLTYKESTKKNNTTEMTIRKWRKRFKEEGLDGLKDKPRPGQPILIDQETRTRIIHLACTKPDDGRQRYSQAEIAEMTGVSQSRVCDILKSQDLKPHKTEYWCGKSPDPDFEAKMINIIGLYLNPPENALVLCVDEKTQIQALDRTQPELPIRQGTPRRLTNRYKRNGTANLVAALAVHDGEITARDIPKNDAENFLKFLKVIDRKYTNVEIHLILDNLSIHKSKKVKEWLNKKRKFHTHFTPTYSSWLNQIETWFSILTNDVLKDAVWGSKKELVDQLITYIKYYNENRAKPFNWTYGKDKIKY